eukprot:4915237-Lingulodinium_polyedra.AAC.1
MVLDVWALAQKPNMTREKMLKERARLQSAEVVASTNDLTEQGDNEEQTDVSDGDDGDNLLQWES